MNVNLEEEIIAFLNGYLEEAKEKFSFLKGKGIAGRNAGYYFNTTNGLITGTFVGADFDVSGEFYAFLRFWEGEGKEKTSQNQNENIKTKRNILEEHPNDFQALLGKNVTYYHKYKVNGFNSIDNDRHSGFCVLFPLHRKLGKEIKNDLDTALSAIELMSDYMEKPLTDNSDTNGRVLLRKIQAAMDVQGKGLLECITLGKDCLQYKPFNAKDDDWGKKKCHYEFWCGNDENHVPPNYVQICFHCEDNFEFQKEFQELAQKEESLDPVRNVYHGAKKTKLEPEYGKIPIGTDVGDVADNAVKQMLRFEKQYGSKILELIQKSKGEIPSENSNSGERKMNAAKENNEEIALNTILYGPPGTGKTFNTMAYAVAICEGKNVDDVKKEMQENYVPVKQRYDALKDEGRIEFVTFHQSYGYEDFIEGIKPILGDDDNPGLNYELHPGIFKNFCESAEKSFTNSLPDSDKDDAFDKSWNLLLKKLSESEDEKISIELKNKKSFSVGFNETRTGLYAGGRRYFNKKQLRNIYNGQHGVPSGARDSYRRRIVEYMIKYCGLVKNTKKKEVNNNANQNYVFIIDEINRGNISKIFGELITLIEPSKRLGEKESMKVTLPCSGDEFGVPNNVYILGTMNTADRSIAMMDTALRRRFNFVEMMSDTSESSPLNGKKIEGIDICKMLMTINKRIEYLYDREHTIGHAFFIGVNDFAGLSSVFRNKVIPLLQEYFYDDYEKIRLVLRDNGKSEEHQFVTKKKPEPNLFGGLVFEDGSDDEKYIYEVNEKAFNLQKSYEGII